MSYLWKAYPLAPQVLEEVKQHLRDNNFLTQDDKWNPVKATAEQFRTQGSGREIETFAFFSDLMNAILVSLRNAGRKTFVKMVNAGNFKPESDMINSSKPDAFLCVDTGSTSNQKKFKWRDLTCPIEYEFGKGDRVDNDSKVLWSLNHIMRCDPCRMFSFGSTVCGTEFQIWLLCRAAPFIFDPFDWFNDPNSLIKFFIILGTSSEADLGFDPKIKRIREFDFDLCFTIEGVEYETTMLLYDIGADPPNGRVFEAEDRKTEEKYVIKDCWVEERLGKELEYEIVKKIKADMGDEHFNKYIIGIHTHQKTLMSGGFGDICDSLENRTFRPTDGFAPRILFPVPKSKQPYTSGAPVANQDNRLKPTKTILPPERPPHPRSRYQVVYKERGISLFEVTSLVKIFIHIGQAMRALFHLHAAGWLHRDPSPGNVIVVGNTAKLSDLEFAKKRSLKDLEELTRPKDPPSSGPAEMRTGIFENEWRE